MVVHRVLDIPAHRFNLSGRTGFAAWAGFTARSVSRLTNLHEALLNHRLHRTADLGGAGPHLGDSRHTLRFYRPQLLLPPSVTTTAALGFVARRGPWPDCRAILDRRHPRGDRHRRRWYRGYKGPALVRGGAGTGKTVVAMHLAKHLADQIAADPVRSDDRILFTTFTTILAYDIAACAGWTVFVFSHRSICDEGGETGPALSGNNEDPAGSP
jgi:hypothetical protein